MKTIILYLHLCIFCSVLANAQTASAKFKEIEQTQIPTVFIISAYSNHVEWSRNLSNKLGAAITEKYPRLQVHIQNMKMDEVLNNTGISLSFRAMIWSFDEQSGPYARELDASQINAWQIFATNYLPCLIIIIGDEGLLNYQRWSIYAENWNQIPLLLWSTADTLSSVTWVPQTPVDPNLFEPIESKRTKTVIIKEEHYNRLNDSLKRLVQQEKDHQILSVHYNLTGVVAQIKIRENLELIQQLCPNIEELVYIDSDFYKTQTINHELEKQTAIYLPNVKFSHIIQKKTNSDSIFQIISESNSKRAYLSYAWNTSAYISKHSQSYIDSLFIYKTKSPLFSLTQRDTNNNYWVGGYYHSTQDGINEILAQVGKAQNGENLATHPFKSLDKYQYILNQTALKRYGLYSNSKKIQDNIVYVNIPLSFYRKHEKHILIGIILLIILFAMSYYLYRHYFYLKNTETETARFKTLYNKLQNMYNAAKIDFAMYDKNGILIFCVIKGTRLEKEAVSEHIFAYNLFSNPLIKGIKSKDLLDDTSFNREILYEDTPFIFNAKRIRIKQYASIEYMAVMVNTSVVQKERDEKKLYEQMFELACDFSRIGIAFYNYKEQKFTASEIWYENLYEPNTSPALPKFSMINSASKEKIQDFLKQAETKKDLPAFSADFPVSNTQNEEHWIKLNIFYNPNNPDIIIIFNLNTDAQKESEKSLVDAKIKAELSEKEITEFLNNISHELRTPMNAIVGFSQVLSDAEEEERSEYINIIKQNSNLLDNLVNNIIQLSRINSGAVTYKITEFKIFYLFYELQKNFNQMITEKGLKFELVCKNEDQLIKSDRNYLYLVLLNLINNAIKFTESGTITLGIENDTIYVKDTGCGIASENHARIFKEFEKVNTYTQGTGLGLALCKRTIEQLGGTMGVESTPGAGTQFWIKLS